MAAFTLRTTTEFAETFPKIPALVRHPVRCGKPTCRCARGELHESWRLVWRDSTGAQRRRHVRKAELAVVRAILDQRRAERAFWRMVEREATEKMAAIRVLCHDLDQRRKTR